MEASDGSICIIRPDIPILSVSSFKSGNSVLYIKILYESLTLWNDKLNNSWQKCTYTQKK